MTSYQPLLSPASSSSSPATSISAPYFSLASSTPFSPPSPPDAPGPGHSPLSLRLVLLLLVVFLLTSLCPLMMSFADVVTADAVYTPTFNATVTASYNSTTTVTGTGRYGISPIFLYRDSFPTHTRLTVDGVLVSETNDTYRSTIGSAAFSCVYPVYALVTRVDARSGLALDGDRLELTVPGCAALTLVRVCLMLNQPVLFVAFIAVWLLTLMLYREASVAQVVKYGLHCWYAGLACTVLATVLGIVLIAATWAFVGNSGFVHPTVTWVPYVHIATVALIAVAATCLLTATNRDMKTLVAAGQPTAEAESITAAAVASL